MMERMELMSIGDFARATGLTPKALRIYDDLRLLPPAEVDERTGYRFYAAEQLEQARLIAALRRVGMPLDRIRVALRLPAAAIAAELTSFWRQTEADVRSRRTQVSALVADLRSKESTMTTTRTPRTRAAHALGRGAREEQLDAVHFGTDLWAVADGFHGTPSVAEEFVRHLASEAQPIGVERWDALAAECAAGLPDDGRGSTFTAVALNGDIATIAHLGDSRAWLMRDGVLRQLTTDHTEVAALLEDGRLSEEEARLHPRRAVLNRALAAGLPTDPDVVGVTVQRGDRLVLTTDGVHALFPAERLGALLAADDADAAVAAVSNAVRDAGEPDNHAIVVIDVEG
ncbi:MerR family transcriptional regulator [Microbacterium bovistercoris]|uniref:MerR family transcriptional regulator n=1 Tax=Microbacterium bovistercoris TaxID=2293570 RepID=A0A371NW06_9MICO|nr:MerR family transcriptional regulator [Microbacterium bovistercoris]REJ06986.1 MerR family transcriptional regulator [Microbacterium bovistercoris]